MPDCSSYYSSFYKNNKEMKYGFSAKNPTSSFEANSYS